MALFPPYTSGHACGGLHVRNVTAMFVQQGQFACLIRSVARLHVILSSFLYGASAVSYFLSVSLVAGTGAVYTVAEAVVSVRRNILILGQRFAIITS